MADIDRKKFADNVIAELTRRGLSFRDAQDRFTSVTAGLLSKVDSKFRISAENMLAICQHLALNPFDYLEIDTPNPLGRRKEIPKGESVSSLLSKLKQCVPVVPPRETDPKRRPRNKKARSASVMARALLRDLNRRETERERLNGA